MVFNKDKNEIPIDANMHNTSHNKSQSCIIVVKVQQHRQQVFGKVNTPIASHPHVGWSLRLNNQKHGK